MMKCLLAVVVLLTGAVCLHGHDVEEFQMDPFTPKSDEPRTDSLRLLGMNWTNCDSGPKIITLTSLSVDPDPVILGSKITISGALNVQQDVGVSGQVISGDMELKMKVGDEYRDMCPLIGSKLCHLTDVCMYMKLVSHRCPSIIEAMGNNCTCPIKQKVYEVKQLSMILPTIPVELTGSFDVTLRLKDQTKELMCVDLKFCIKDCS